MTEILHEAQAMLDAIAQKIKNSTCPCCDENDFVIVDGYANQNIDAQMMSKLPPNGEFVPCVMMVCNNCGYVRQHALSCKGLMPD